MLEALVKSLQHAPGLLALVIVVVIFTRLTVVIAGKAKEIVDAYLDTLKHIGDDCHNVQREGHEVIGRNREALDRNSAALGANSEVLRQTRETLERIHRDQERRNPPPG